jgi:AraC-like DNA-binding protein
LEAGDYDPRIRILLCRMHRLESWSLPNLSAPHWRLYWNTVPGASVVLGGRETQLVPARCMVIPPNTPYAARLVRPVTHFYLHFLAAPPYDAVAPEIFTFPVPPEILAAIREARGLLPADAPAGPQLAVLCHYLAAWALSRLPAGKVPVARTDERVAAALRIMEENFSRPPGNADLAERAGMNVNAFIRLFRKTTGQSPQASFAAKRIERACLLLHGSAMSIKEIAAATGFCDRYHFSRVFKRLRGVGPAEFRRRSYWTTAIRRRN